MVNLRGKKRQIRGGRISEPVKIHFHKSELTIKVGEQALLKVSLSEMGFFPLAITEEWNLPAFVAVHREFSRMQRENAKRLRRKN